MTWTKRILAGLISGTLALGLACQSNKAAEREPSDVGTPPAEGTGGAGDEGFDEGFDEGYEEDAPGFDDSQELGGDRFPSDDIVPQ